MKITNVSMLWAACLVGGSFAIVPTDYANAQSRNYWSDSEDDDSEYGDPSNADDDDQDSDTDSAQEARANERTRRLAIAGDRARPMPRSEISPENRPRRPRTTDDDLDRDVALASQAVQRSLDATQNTLRIMQADAFQRSLDATQNTLRMLQENPVLRPATATATVWSNYERPQVTVDPEELAERMIELQRMSQLLAGAHKRPSTDARWSGRLGDNTRNSDGNIDESLVSDSDVEHPVIPNPQYDPRVWQGNLGANTRGEEVGKYHYGSR
jgi:hypothetical protein